MTEKEKTLMSYKCFKLDGRVEEGRTPDLCIANAHMNSNDVSIPVSIRYWIYIKSNGNKKISRLSANSTRRKRLSRFSNQK